MRSAKHDESRLPKWAQSELYKLRGDLNYWRTRALAGPATSDTFIDYSDSEKPLGQGETIRFRLRDFDGRFRGSLRASIAETHDGTRYLDVSGSEGIIVRPWASNVVRIFITDL